MANPLFAGRPKDGNWKAKEMKISGDSIARAARLCNYAQPTGNGFDCLTKKNCIHKLSGSCLKPMADGILVPVSE